MRHVAARSIVPALIALLALAGTPAGASATPTSTTTIPTVPTASAFCQAAVAAGANPAPLFPFPVQESIVSVGDLMQAVPTSAGVNVIRPYWPQLRTLLGDYLATISAMTREAPTLAQAHAVAPHAAALVFYAAHLRELYALSLTRGAQSAPVLALARLMARHAGATVSAQLYFSTLPTSGLSQLCPAAAALQGAVQSALNAAQQASTDGYYDTTLLERGVAQSGSGSLTLRQYPSDPTRIGLATFATASLSECVLIPGTTLLPGQPTPCVM